MTTVIYTGPVLFGEVLFDQFPGGQRVLGGAPFNIAWHLQIFCLSPLLISRVGDDPCGRLIRQQMLVWGMDTFGLQMDSAHPTGLVDISFHKDEPDYEIVENSAWDFIDKDVLPPIHEAIKLLLYYGSLALRQASGKPINFVLRLESTRSLMTLKYLCKKVMFYLSGQVTLPFELLIFVLATHTQDLDYLYRE